MQSDLFKLSNLLFISDIIVMNFVRYELLYEKSAIDRGAHQRAHLHRLFSTFVVCCSDSVMALQFL